MDIVQVITLALIQGLTEFLPISSSAHLILVPVLTPWEDQGLAFDVAVHLGTLAAVVLYFRRDLAAMIREWIASLAGRGLTPEARLAWAVLLGTLPVGLAGLTCKDFIESHLRSPLVIGVASIGFGLLLWWADARGRRDRHERDMTWRDVVLIGAAQALALIPGTSRSGATITAGLAVGLTRAAAARFSFLLSIPVIVLAGGLETLELMGNPHPAQWRLLLAGAVIAGLSAYLCIHLFLKALEHMGMLPFVIYRLVLGVGLLFLFA